MAYVYQTVLRRENYDFDICQNKHNSKFTSIIAIDRKTRNTINLGKQNNRSGEIELFEHSFKKETVELLKQKLQLS